jgi:hypothetical protein
MTWGLSLHFTGGDDFQKYGFWEGFPPPRHPASANLVGGANLLGRQIYLAQGTDNLLAVMVVRIYSAHAGAKFAAP